MGIIFLSQLLNSLGLLSNNQEKISKGKKNPMECFHSEGVVAKMLMKTPLDLPSLPAGYSSQGRHTLLLCPWPLGRGGVMGRMSLSPTVASAGLLGRRH